MATPDRKSSVSLLKRSLSDVIQCAICISSPRDPRSLPCLHTYCQTCLEEFHNRCLEKKQVSVNKIKCPECQKVSELPPGGISKLPADFRIKQIEDIFNEVLGNTESEISFDRSDNNPLITADVSCSIYDNIDDVTIKSKSVSSQMKNGIEQQPQILNIAPEKQEAKLSGVTNAVYGIKRRPSEGNNRLKVADSQLPTTPKLLNCTDDMARNLHLLIEKNPSRAKGYLKDLSSAERKVVISKLIEGQSALCVAFHQQAYDLMIYIIERCHADVNQIILGHAADGRDIESCLLIHVAASKDLTAAQVLVSHGAKVNQADGEGITPLFVACVEGSLKMVEYLIEVGANVNYNGNKYGASPLMAASTNGNIPIIKCLISNGADVNTAQKDGYTPLMAACQKAPEPELVAAFLLTHWAEINAQDSKGYTPLMYAVRRGSLDTVELLLMNKAHVNVKDAIGQTVLHQAVTLSSLVLSRLLVKRGADPYLRDRYGNTCLDLAVHNPDIVAVLKTYKKIKKKK